MSLLSPSDRRSYLARSQTRHQGEEVRGQQLDPFVRLCAAEPVGMHGGLRLNQEQQQQQQQQQHSLLTTTTTTTTTTTAGSICMTMRCRTCGDARGSSTKPRTTATTATTTTQPINNNNNNNNNNNSWIHLYDYALPNLWGCTGVFD